MGESSKAVDEGLAVLRGFPIGIRIAVLLCLVLPGIAFLRGHYGWPDWPAKDAVWLNVAGLACVVAALAILMAYTPRPAMSVAELPETKPVFEESLKYFKTGPELKGTRGELLKALQFEYEKAGAVNRYLLAPAEMSRCQTSPWEFDRVACYLYERYRSAPAPEERIKRVSYELRLLGTRDWTGSLVPLHYAVESVYPGAFERGLAPVFSPAQLEPFREIVGELDSWGARIKRLWKGSRGKGIVRNCRDLLGKAGAA